MINHGQIGMLNGLYRFHHHPNRHRREAAVGAAGDSEAAAGGSAAAPDNGIAAILAHPQVEAVWPLVPKRRVRRFIPSDPLFNREWYLATISPFGLWQQPAWDRGLNGSGVVVAVVDDGLEYDHPDLSGRFDPLASHNFNSRRATDPHRGDSSDPYPDRADTINKHGTRCAGAVGATASNGECGAGVAFGARIGGIRMLDGPVDDAIEAGSLGWNNQHVDIYSCSWGPDDDGKTYDGPGPLTAKILRDGVRQGRYGLGSVFIWAAGNGGSADQCNCDGYVTSMYTLGINAVGRGGSKPAYTEKCTSVMASVTPGAITTDIFGKCTRGFSGTSAAAPVAAGAVALVLQANPCLSWRDIQHIVIRAATPHGDDSHRNAAGLSYSITFGFGVLNTTRMTELAESWVPVGAAVQLSIGSTGPPPPPWRVIDLEISVTGCDVSGNTCISRLEHVEFNLVLSTTGHRGQVMVTLTSPSGMISQLLRPRPVDTRRGTIDWTFLSVAHWGESAQGSWHVTIASSDTGSITVKSWRLNLHGTANYSSHAFAGPGHPTLPNVTIPQGCDVCPGTMFADGEGGCLPCHPHCTLGCVAYGRDFCMLESSDGGADADGASKAELNIWFLPGNNNTVKKAVLAVLAVALVVGFVNGVWRMTCRKPIARDLDDGSVGLLSPDADAFDYEGPELDTIGAPSPLAGISTGAIMDARGGDAAFNPAMAIPSPTHHEGPLPPTSTTAL